MKKMISMRFSPRTLEKLDTLATEYEKSRTEIMECAVLALFLKASERSNLIEPEKANARIEQILDELDWKTPLPFE